MSIEGERKKTINRAKSDRLEGLFLPEIKADLKARPTVMLMDLVRDVEKIANEYVKHNCFQKDASDETDGDDIPAGTFLKFTPGVFFVEVDVFADQRIFHQQLRGTFLEETLELNESHAKAIYAIVMKNLFCLPDNKESKEVFKQYVEKIAQLGVRFYFSDDADKKLAQSRFVTTFASFYRSYIEKNYFDLDFKPIVKDDAQSLKQRFTDGEILLPSDQVNNKGWKRITDVQKLRNFIEQGYQFFGYDDSIYDYVKFDTLPEKQLADYSDAILRLSDTEQRFWVRNDRQVYFYYGTRRYYPDFLMFRNGIIYALEIKGEIYSDTKKNILLSRLNTIDGYRGVLIYSDFMNRVTSDTPFEDFLKGADLDAEIRHGKERLIEEVAEDDKFVRYLPAYTPEKAYRRFVQKRSKVRIDGWLRVLERHGNYSDDYFVVQMKGDALSPELSHNEWAIFAAGRGPGEAIDKIVIFHHAHINDERFGRVTIRKFGFKRTKPPSGLFEQLTVFLTSTSEETPSFEVNDITADSGIEIAGVMVATA
ncbi:MAG: hypothetical protein DMF69_24175 [Acidobacteria bacterium]|nr:MAG: hypothetical protein DMF69_24175 [Acidobacteriota bacterium]